MGARLARANGGGAGPEPRTPRPRDRGDGGGQRQPLAPRLAPPTPNPQAERSLRCPAAEGTRGGGSQASPVPGQ